MRLDDVVGREVRLLLVGINPGLRSAARNRHFAGPGNRFWPSLAAAGITPEPFGPDDQHRLPELGVGITNLVARETVRATEVTGDELRAGALRLAEQVASWRPRVVAVLGVTAYRRAFSRPQALVGRQPETIGGAALWLLANPSGLNASWQVADHAVPLREAADAAGLVRHGSNLRGGSRRT